MKSAISPRFDEKSHGISLKNVQKVFREKHIFRSRASETRGGTWYSQKTLLLDYRVNYKGPRSMKPVDRVILDFGDAKSWTFEQMISDLYCELCVNFFISKKSKLWEILQILVIKNNLQQPKNTKTGFSDLCGKISRLWYNSEAQTRVWRSKIQWTHRKIMIFSCTSVKNGFVYFLAAANCIL